jgi:sugar phosphate isomerase/epimerase
MPLQTAVLSLLLKREGGDKLFQVSLSTMWAQGRFKHMTEFVVKARDFGFTQIEAHSSLSPEMLDELIETSAPISSIHSPCPTSLSSKGIPVASLSLSSTEESERREAIGFAKKTIDHAPRIGTRIVIIHMGEVPANADLEEKLRRLYQEGLMGSEMYVQVKKQLISERSSKASRYLEQARKSLDELSKYSKAQGIILGLENRVSFREIPNIDEMNELLNGVERDSVGYWHDVGHAEVQGQLGFTPHEEWLLRLNDRIIGIHLHDVIGISDHCVPGKGNVNWGMIAKYLPQRVIRTCEINQWNEGELIREAIPFLLNAGIICRR